MSLSCFVYAEMPELEALERDFPKHQCDVIEDEILPRLRKHFGSSFQANVHRVGKLYEEIIDLISNERRIPDSMFDEIELRVSGVMGRMGPRLQDCSAAA